MGRYHPYIIAGPVRAVCRAVVLADEGRAAGGLVRRGGVRMEDPPYEKDPA